MAVLIPALVPVPFGHDSRSQRTAETVIVDASAELEADTGTGAFVPPVKRVKPVTPAAPAEEEAVPLPERKPEGAASSEAGKPEKGALRSRTKAKAAERDGEDARERKRAKKRRVAAKEVRKRR